MSDSLSNGRVFRILNILDDYNREDLWIEVSLTVLIYTSRCRLNVCRVELPECISPHECGRMSSSEKELETLHEEETYELHVFCKRK